MEKKKHSVIGIAVLIIEKLQVTFPIKVVAYKWKAIVEHIRWMLKNMMIVNILFC